MHKAYATLLARSHPLTSILQPIKKVTHVIDIVVMLQQELVELWENINLELSPEKMDLVKKYNNQYRSWIK